MEDKGALHRESDGPIRKAKPRSGTGFICIIGTVVGYSAMLAAHGNGWSPLVFLAIGLFVTPIVAMLVQWGMRVRPWTARGLAFVFIGVLCFALAKYSRRIDRNLAFVTVFEIPPPPGLNVIAARKQWFDGIDYLIVFQSNRAGIDTLLSRGKYEDISDRVHDTNAHELQVPFLDVSVIVPETFTLTHVWEFQKKWLSANSADPCISQPNK